MIVFELRHLIDAFRRRRYCLSLWTHRVGTKSYWFWILKSYIYLRYSCSRLFLTRTCIIDWKTYGRARTWSHRCVAIPPYICTLLEREILGTRFSTPVLTILRTPKSCALVWSSSPLSLVRHEAIVAATRSLGRSAKMASPRLFVLSEHTSLLVTLVPLVLP